MYLFVFLWCVLLRNKKNIRFAEIEKNVCFLYKLPLLNTDLKLTLKIQPLKQEAFVLALSRPYNSRQVVSEEKAYLSLTVNLHSYSQTEYSRQAKVHDIYSVKMIFTIVKSPAGEILDIWEEKITTLLTLQSSLASLFFVLRPTATAAARIRNTFHIHMQDCMS